MTAKYYGTTHRHPFKWDDVASAIFMRYPNPFATHVLSEDTLHRELVSRDILYSRRFLTKTNRLPKWGERFFSNLKKFVPLVEESHIDRGSKIMQVFLGVKPFFIHIFFLLVTVQHIQEMLVCQDLWLLSKKSSMSLILIILMRPLPLKKLGLSLDSMD